MFPIPYSLPVTCIILLTCNMSMNDAEYEELGYGTSPCFVGKRVDLSLIPQYVREYDRGNDVELWHIKFAGRKPVQKIHGV